MGAACTTVSCDAYGENPRLLKYRSNFEGINLHDADIGRLYFLYKKMDIDHSGKIRLYELLLYFDIGSSVFHERIFNLFDNEHKGEINFYEFVMGIYNYCTLEDMSTLSKTEMCFCCPVTEYQSVLLFTTNILFPNVFTQLYLRSIYTTDRKVAI